MIDQYTLRMRQPIQVVFEPQPDITAYELAQILKYFHGQPIYELAELGELARHFKEPT